MKMLRNVKLKSYTHFTPATAVSLLKAVFTKHLQQQARYVVHQRFVLNTMQAKKLFINL